jgi:UDP-N-acetyl-3-dehydro-alpha-D-glucosamine 3-aminotranferase
MPAIPLFDTETPLRPLRGRIQERVLAVLEGGRYILGPEVRAFESELAAYLGVRHVVGVANGTDAITIGLRALGVKPGDEVVVPAFTFYASAEAIATAGAVPVFCDVDPDTRNVTAETVGAALTPRTTAIVAVDLFGCPAPVPELRALGLPVLEDAAQAAGASLAGRMAGALGDLATFSFYPSKNLGCFGDGGAIATDNGELAELATALRFHGSRDKRDFQYVGYNSRLDEIQAAVLRVLLPELDGWTAGRRAAAQAYAEAGVAQHVGTPAGPPGAEPAWHLYVVTHPRADELIGALTAQGIQARGYYRVPLHRQPAMLPYIGDTPPALPVTDELSRTNLALPMSSVLGSEQARAVATAVAGFASG